MVSPWEGLGVALVTFIAVTICLALVRPYFRFMAPRKSLTSSAASR